MFNSKLKKERDRLIELNKTQNEQIDRLNATNEKLIELNVLQCEEIDILNTTTEEIKAYVKTIEGLIMMDVEKLRQQPNIFPAPTFNDETGAWETTTAFCSLGGCEYSYFLNHTEREALQQSVLATLKGQKVDMGGACSECYSEYMSDCV